MLPVDLSEMWKEVMGFVMRLAGIGRAIDRWYLRMNEMILGLFEITVLDGHSSSR